MDLAGTGIILNEFNFPKIIINNVEKALNGIYNNVLYIEKEENIVFKIDDYSQLKNFEKNFLFDKKRLEMKKLILTKNYKLMGKKLIFIQI